MKTDVLEIVKNALGGAEDNLFRANRAFGRMTDEELSLEHGQSGRTRGSILAGYQDDKTRLERCIKWVESAT